MTIAEEVAQCLKEKRFEEVADKVQNYLSAVKNGELSEKDSQRKAAFALRFLFHFMESWEEVDSSKIWDMIKLVSLCHKCIEKYQKEGSDPIHEQKILYHLLSKSLKRESLDESSGLADIFHSSLQSVADEHKSQIHPLAFGAYASAWNVALRMCDQAPVSAFKLRKAAILLLLLSDKSVAMVIERTTWTFENYVSQMKKNVASSQDTCSDVLDLFHAVVALLKQHRSHEDDYEKSYIELHYRVLHYMLNNSKNDATDAVAQKLTHAREISDKLANNREVLNSLYQVQALMMQAGVLIKYESNKGSKSKSKDSTKSNSLSRLLKDINKAFDSVDPAQLSQPELQLLVSCGSLLVRQVDLDANAASTEKSWLNNESKEELLRISHLLVTCSESEERLFQNSKKKDNSKCLWLCQELSRCISLILFIHQNSVQLANGVEDVEETLSETQKIVSEHRVRLESLLLCNPIKIAAEHLVQLGSTSNKFGRWCLRKSAYEHAGKFMQETKECYKTVVESELLSAEKLLQCRLWSKMELCAECWRFSNDYEKAKEAVVLGLLWEPLEYSAAATTWARVQTDILKHSSEDKPYSPQTLWNAVKDKGHADLDAASLLKEEFHVHKKSRWGRAELERHLVEELLTVLTSKEDRGIYLLEKASLLWSIDHDNNRAQLCCEEAVALLEEVLASISKKKSSADRVIVVKEHLARAHLWRHLVKDVKIDQIKSETLTSNPAEKAKDWEDPSNYQDCFTVAMENFKDVDLARTMWQEVMEVKDVHKVIWCPNTTLESLSALSSVYRLANKPIEELGVLQMILKLSQLVENDDFILQAFLRLLENGCHLQQPDVVSNHLIAMETWMEGGAWTKIQKTAGAIWCLMAKAAALVFVGKVSEGMESFEKAHQLKEDYTQNKSRTKSVFLLDGSLKLSQARLKDILEAGDNLKMTEPSCENSTELRLAATRILSGVICYQFGQWVLTPSGKKENESTGDEETKNRGKGGTQLETDCWGVLSQVMDCLSETGSALTRLGDYREAKCYLLQGLKIAQSFHVPRRFAEFHLALAHLDNLAGKFSNSRAHLNTAAYLLQGGRSTSLGEEETEEREEEEEEEMVINTVDVNQEEEEDSEPHRSSLGGSPNTKRLSAPKIPSHWSHPNKCDCNQCGDVILNRLYLQLLVMEVECLQFQKHHREAEKFSKAFEKNVQHLVEKGMNGLKRIMGEEQSKLLQPSLYKDLQSEWNILLLEKGLDEENYKLQMDAFGRVNSLLNCGDSSQTKAYASILAYLHYLEAVPSLKWPCPGDDEELSRLTSAVRKLSLGETAATKTPRQPIPNRKVRAPRKNEPPGDNEAKDETPMVPSGGKINAGSPGGEKKKKKKERSLDKTPDITDVTNSPSEMPAPVMPLTDITKLQEKSEILFTPPRSCVKNARREAAINSIFDSDSDEEWKPSTCSAPTRKKRPQDKTLKQKTSVDQSRKKNIDKNPVNRVKNQENVYEFVLSEDDGTPRQPGSKTQRKTVPKAKKNGVKTEVSKSKLPVLSAQKTKKTERKTARKGRSKNQIDPDEMVEQARECCEDEDNLMNRNNRFSLPDDSNGLSRKLSIDSGRKSLNSSKNEVESTLDSSMPNSSGKTSRAKGRSKAGNVGSQTKVASENCEKRSKGTTKSKKTLENGMQTSSKKEMNDSVNNGKKNVPDIEKRICRSANQITRKVRLTRANTETAEKERFETSESDELDLDSMNLSINMPEDELDTSSQSGPEDGISDDADPDNSASPGLLLSDFSPQSFTDNIISSFHTGHPSLKETDEPFLELLTADLSNVPSSMDDLLNSSIEIARAGDDEDSKPQPKVKAKSKTCTFNIYEDAPEKPRRTKIKAARKGSVNFAAKDDVILEKSPKRPEKIEQKSAVKLLERAFKMLKRHPAYLPYRQTCHALAVCHLGNHPSLPVNSTNESPDGADTLWNVAYYLTEAQAVTFRHQALRNINRKIRKIETGGAVSRITAVTEGMKNLGLESEAPDDLRKMHSLLTFDLDVNEVKDMVECIPQDFVVCHLSVLEPPGQAPCLIASRFQSGCEPVIVYLPGFSTQKGLKLLSEYESVQVANKESLEAAHKAIWWSRREQQDARMKTLLEKIEYNWFGVWRGILHGLHKEEEDRENLRKVAVALQQTISEGTGVTLSVVKLQVLLQATSPLNLEAVCQWLTLEVGGETTEKIAEVARAVVREHKKLLLLLGFGDHQPVILMLDKVIQQIPWESLPELRSTPVCRMPSLHFLRFYMRSGPGKEPSSPYNKGVDPSKTYYVLDPENNLPSTREQFQKVFREKNWKGVIGRQPTTEEYAEALMKNDLFIYCGHGGGAKYLSGDNIQWLQSKAVALLMGCSSGKLANQGRLESHGLIMHYFLAGCPSMVGCLWDVTDKDIDRYLERLLSQWVAADSDPSLPVVAAQSRTVCKMPYLVGAAPVVYGLPVSIIR